MIESTRPARYPAGLNLLQTEYLPLASSHYYAIGANDNNADCVGSCNIGWRDDDNNRVDPDSNSRWDNSRWDNSRWDNSRWDNSRWDNSGWDNSRWHTLAL